MLGDDNDSAQAKNQFLAIMLMTMLAMFWLMFMMPQQPPPEQETQKPDQTELATPGEYNDIVIDASDSEAPTAIQLPPTDTEAISNPELATLENSALRLEFTPVGARLKRATVLLGIDGEDSVQLVPEWGDVSDTQAVYPLGLRFSKEFLGGKLDTRLWDVKQSTDGKALIFSYEIPEVARITKQFSLTESAHVLDCQVSYTSLESKERVLGLDNKEPAYSLYWGPNVDSKDTQKGSQQEIIWRKDSLNTHHSTAKLEPPAGSLQYTHWVDAPDWAGVKSAYFVVALKPEYEAAEAWATGDPKNFRLGLNVPRMALAPGETQTREFKLYTGPTELNALKEAELAGWPELDTALQFFTMFGFMDTFAKLLLSILHFFYSNVVANYGVAIILLTVLVRLIMFPLTFKSALSMRKMQKLQPEMQAIREEYKEDQTEMNRQVMMLYKDRGVNPLGGCFPIFLQMPVFIALYRMLWSAFELRGAPFMLWINDLSEPDALFNLPFAIPVPFTQPWETFNLLPILMGMTMWLSMKMTPMSTGPQNEQQQMIMKIMPFMFALICYNVASGLNLYILLSTVLGIAQSWAIRIYDPLPVHDPEAAPIVVKKEVPKEKPKKKAATRPKPKDFYSAAQYKKREMKKEQRRQKKDNKGSGSR